MALTEEQKAARTAKRLLASALREEARAHRDEARRQEWRDNGMYLTREQAAAGEPCRGCGLAVIDNLGNWPGTMYLTDEERIQYDTAEARYRQLHPNCDSHRWSMAGSRTTHCGCCCPPIPISQQQAEHIGQLLATFARPRDENLDVWECTLTCGHIVEQTVHHSNHAPSFSTQLCPECQTTRGVVSSHKTVDAAARAAEAKRRYAQQLASAERDVAKAGKAARDAQRKLDALRREDPQP